MFSIHIVHLPLLKLVLVLVHDGMNIVSSAAGRNAFVEVSNTLETQGLDCKLATAI